MQIELKEKPKKGAVIIEGFPGFGLVSTIATEYLVDHLNARLIGKISSDKIPAIIAIHRGQIVEPLGIFYDEKNNIVIIRAIANVNGLEWEITESIAKLAEEIKAKEIISIEGISSDNKPPEPEAFFFTKDEEKRKRFENLKMREIDEGIIVGVTASLMTKMPETTFIFTEAISELPDSRAAAKVIEVLDNYLKLKVDYKPLVKKAEDFEKKIREILMKTKEISKIKEKKETYFG
ncbi:MAG: PAC2 family protein [Candidatus Pacearchaeota archaeon]